MSLLYPLPFLFSLCAAPSSAKEFTISRVHVCTPRLYSIPRCGNPSTFSGERRMARNEPVPVGFFAHRINSRIFSRTPMKYRVRYILTAGHYKLLFAISLFLPKFRSDFRQLYRCSYVLTFFIIFGSYMVIVFKSSFNRHTFQISSKIRANNRR